MCVVLCLLVDGGFFFFKQKTAYEMRISDWSSDVCSSDLIEFARFDHLGKLARIAAINLDIDIGKFEQEDLDDVAHQRNERSRPGSETNISGFGLRPLAPIALDFLGERPDLAAALDDFTGWCGKYCTAPAAAEQYHAKPSLNCLDALAQCGVRW